MVLKASTEVLVPFHDVDIMHIAWHGHYIKYFELARTKLMQSLQLDWPYLQSQNIAMPVVEAHAQYRRPILYNQTIEIEASIEEFMYPELVIQYRIFSTDTARLLLSSGWTRQVYANPIDRSSYFTTPEIVAAAFETAQKRLSHE